MIFRNHVYYNILLLNHIISVFYTEAINVFLYVFDWKIQVISYAYLIKYVYNII